MQVSTLPYNSQDYKAIQDEAYRVGRQWAIDGNNTIPRFADVFGVQIRILGGWTEISGDWLAGYREGKQSLK